MANYTNRYSTVSENGRWLTMDTVEENDIYYIMYVRDNARTSIYKEIRLQHVTYTTTQDNVLSTTGFKVNYHDLGRQYSTDEERG